MKENELTTVLLLGLAAAAAYLYGKSVASSAGPSYQPSSGAGTPPGYYNPGYSVIVPGYGPNGAAPIVPNAFGQIPNTAGATLTNAANAIGQVVGLFAGSNIFGDGIAAGDPGSYPSSFA